MSGNEATRTLYQDRYGGYWWYYPDTGQYAIAPRPSGVPAPPPTPDNAPRLNPSDPATVVAPGTPPPARQVVLAQPPVPPTPTPPPVSPPSAGGGPGAAPAPAATPPPAPIDWASRALGKWKPYFQNLNSDQQTYYTTPAGKQDAWTLASQQELGQGKTETPWARWLRGRVGQAQSDYANTSMALGDAAKTYQFTDYINDAMPDLKDEFNMFSAKMKGTEQRWMPAGRGL